MGEPALKLENSEDKNIDKDSLKRVEKTESQELIIGLCGPIGTAIHGIAEKIENILVNDYDYEVHKIKLSHLIDINTKTTYRPKTSDSPEYVRLKDLILRGNEFRKSSKNNRILAELAIKKIGLERSYANKNPQEVSPKTKERRVCYIIDSIKNKSEYEILKAVYRNLFYFFGVFSPLDRRKANLNNRKLSDSEIFDLIDQDSGEDIANGQDVKNTFMLADFFVRIDTLSSEQIIFKLKRYFHLIFGTDIITPFPGETAMYHASSAASNSGCLSRQVGASIIDKSGALISIGWNDVPKFGGGVYESDEKDTFSSKDYRCKCIDPKKCFNKSSKEEIYEQIINKLKKENLLIKDKEDEVISIIKESKIKDLIEYSRSIHAEMHAIIKGAQKTGSAMVGGKLYCTTYPCHNCARHIILAGIEEVYYIEPYLKSLSLKLHFDAITENETEQNKVRIRMYDGVAPSRYLELFKMHLDNRKEPSVNPRLAKPKYPLSLARLEELESVATISLSTDLKIN